MMRSILPVLAAILLFAGCTSDQFVLRHATMRADLPLTPVHANRPPKGGYVEFTAAGAGASPISHHSVTVGSDDWGAESQARVRWERIPLSGAIQIAGYPREDIRVFLGYLGGSGLGGYGGVTYGLTDRRFEWDFECALGAMTQRTEGVYARESNWSDDEGNSTVRAEEFAFADRTIAGWSQIGVTVRSKAPGWGGYVETRFLPRFQLYSFQAEGPGGRERLAHLSFPGVFGAGIHNALPTGGRLLAGVRFFMVGDQTIPVGHLQYTTSLGSGR